MEDTIDKSSAITVLEAAFKAWNATSGFRSRRIRNKRFTYGDQWIDLTVNDDGKQVTEREALLENGREPLSNNMIRQLVKSVVGRYRCNAKQNRMTNKWLAGVLADNESEELDSRLLEEFLISGCCVQKVGVARRMNRDVVAVENINPNSFFMNSIIDVRGNDIVLIGEIHDWSLSEIIMKLAGDNRSKGAWIRQLYDDAQSRSYAVGARIGADSQSGKSFFSAVDGKCRIFEVWTLEMSEYYSRHDTRTGTVWEYNADTVPENDGVREPGLRWGIRQVWRCRWITPMGDVVARYDSPFSHRSHPYVVKMYPLTDGEIHSFVEDVIDQQKYINRLIVTADHVMSSSAKGVLLYPNDALPAGFTWKKIMQMWKSPGGLILYDSATKIPQQVNGSGTNQGAFELLNLEMRLFDTISGVSGALQGREASMVTGASLYDKQVENSTIALSDIFDTFSSFVEKRNRKLLDL